MRNYPRDEKFRKVGEQFGLIPFVFAAQPLIEESSWADLGDNDFYPHHILPVLVGVVSEAGKMISGVIEALCVRDWTQSPFRLPNPSRQALVGRNVLTELALQVKLDGRRRVTQILDG